jgi:hypothetical protein
VDERLNENRYPLHSVLREIQETDCGDPSADVLHRLEEPVQQSQKRQVACGKNGTSGAILGKRRLLGERILAVAASGGQMTSMRRHGPKLMTDHGVQQQGESLCIDRATESFGLQ